MLVPVHAAPVARGSAADCLRSRHDATPQCEVCLHANRGRALQAISYCPCTLAHGRPLKSSCGLGMRMLDSLSLPGCAVWVDQGMDCLSAECPFGPRSMRMRTVCGPGGATSPPAS